MYKKISVILLLFTACSLFQQEEQAVVSVADTDKGKEATALGVELVDLSLIHISEPTRPY